MIYISTTWITKEVFLFNLTLGFDASLVPQGRQSESCAEALSWEFEKGSVSRPGSELGEC